jgi:VCBS repeat-containing protein
MAFIGPFLTVTGLDTTGTIGLVTNNGDGTFKYDPNGEFEGLAPGETDTDSFKYTVSDGQGGTATATVTITITGVDDLTAGDDFGTR